MNPTDHIIDWLRDAHAMEKQAIELLEKQAKRTENYPEMQMRVEQHLQESKMQAERLETCLKRYDKDGSSGMKDFLGKLTGNFGAITNAMSDDEVVKNTLGNFAFEHFEIACYRSLIAAAEAVGDTFTADACRENLREEEAMAAWADQNIEAVTRMFLQRDQAGMPAKH